MLFIMIIIVSGAARWMSRASRYDNIMWNWHKMPIPRRKCEVENIYKVKMLNFERMDKAKRAWHSFGVKYV